MSKARTVCIDFDWTLCTNDTFGKPNNHLVKLIKNLKKENYRVLIYTSRGFWKSIKIIKWLKFYNIIQYVDKIKIHKPEAVMYIDDRAFRYDPLRKDRTCDDLSVDAIMDLIKEETEELEEATKWN